MITMQGISFDSMLASYVLNSNTNRHNMDALALKYLGHKTITYAEVTGTGAKQICFDEVTIDQVNGIHDSIIGHRAVLSAHRQKRGPRMIIGDNSIVEL